MALLAYHTQDSEQPKWLCGGSLISEQYILTGGNCLLSKKYGEPKFVVLGVTNLNDTSHRQEIKVANRVAHPEYNKGNPYNDIGLLKLEKPVEVNSFVRPACLYTNFDIPVTETIATGWGSTVYFRDNTNEDLLKVTEDIVDYQSCNDSYKTLRGIGKGIINDMHICTGGGSREKGTCRGDAGGPIQIYHNNDPTLCMYDIVGVISFGIRCDGPSVNTRLFYYIKWIEDVVWPENI
ncbi:serine protease snake-like isoform X1 [Zophobas morio]|uniref:serine protease snake-like isoform X1 n=1 Tax=Zophobas morio TaxID=2755281 RepID=UPI003082B46D